VSATVSNDSANAGVTWSCTPASVCGSFNPASAASAAPTTYTAPASAPAGGRATIIATSVKDGTKSAGALVIIPGTASKASLKGQYAFFITAPTGNRKVPSGNWGTTSFLGSVTLDGNGNVTGGVEDLISPGFFDIADPILATNSNPMSFYTVDPSGHGTMQFKTFNNETLDFSFVLISSSHALIIEADGNPGSGTMDLQHPTATGFAASQITGGYSFTMTGTDPSNPAIKLSFGGVFTADGISGLSNGTLDVDNAGVVSTVSFSGSFIAPDSNGRGTMHLNAGRSFTYYIISSKALRIFEGDNIDLMGGSAYAQGATVPPLSGKSVYQHSGWSPAVSPAGRTVAAGQFTANASGGVTAGVSDSNTGGSPTTPSTGKPATGSYVLSGTQNGTLTLTEAAGSSTFNIYMVDPTVNILDPNNSSGGGGALLLHTDASINGTGVLIPQAISANPSFVANHALNLTNSVTISTSTNELDLVGVVSSDDSAKFLNGLADYDQNDSGNPAIVRVPGASVTGTFTADSTNPGHFTGSFTVPTPNTPGVYPFISASATTFNVSFYQASGSQAFVIQTDSTANVSGYLLQQQLP
jgi:hypothetical protein